MKTIFILFFFTILSFAGQKDYSLKPYSKINNEIIDEGSTLEISPNYEGVFWTLNDSGDSARIFALNEKGEAVIPFWIKEYKGIKIYDAYNRDWECLTFDEKGYMYIIDAGNNYNYRRDLAFYKLSEPNPNFNDETGIIGKYPFYCEDQKKFPPPEEEMNFDLEACYFDSGKLFLISKNRGKGPAKIYVLENPLPNFDNKASVFRLFDFESMVTDASVSKDGKYLAVLTYDYIWLFEKKDGDFFKGKFYKKKINLGQAEGISFYQNKLIISNEKRFLFEMELSEIIK